MALYKKSIKLHSYKNLKRLGATLYYLLEEKKPLYKVVDDEWEEVELV